MSDTPTGGVGTSTSAFTTGSAADWQTIDLGIAFFDLSRLAEWGSEADDSRVAEFLQAYYVRAGTTLAAAGARLVKLIGDEGLTVIPPERMQEGVLALCELSVSIRALAREHGFDAYLNVRIHYGAVVSGEFGPPELRRYDVIGKAVNVAARLGGRGVVLTAQAFRQLDHVSRQQFDKRTPPISYHFRRQPPGARAQ